MGAELDDAEYNARFKRYFGIEPLATSPRYIPRYARRTRSLSSRDWLAPSATIRPVWST